MVQGSRLSTVSTNKRHVKEYNTIKIYQDENYDTAEGSNLEAELLGNGTLRYALCIETLINN